MKTTLATGQVDDESLVKLSREGDRDAFSQIVERYQSLICGLTYSACGNLQYSEDLAQVTFITAWCQLAGLKEPSRLKAWLCGIARNVANNSFRRDHRIPTAYAEELDETVEVPAATPSPVDHAISKEEEAILWRSLGELPEIYREPLVLFYRQQQSVAEVAQALDLSEDAVRQRLSRGRSMLTEKVTLFVEGALRQTGPGPVFTSLVVAALPMGTGSAALAGVGAAAKGAGAMKSGGVLSVLTACSPVLGVFGGIVGTWGSIGLARTPRERQFLWRWMLAIWACVLGVVLAQFAAWHLRGSQHWSDEVFVAVQAGSWMVYGMTILAVILFGTRRHQRIKSADGTATDIVCERGRWYGLACLCVAVGVAAGSLGWMVDLALDAGDRVSTMLVSVCILVLALWSAGRAKNAMGTNSEMRALLELALLVVVTIVAMVDWRLHEWLAATRHMDISAVEAAVPLWSVNLCGGLMAAWSVVLWFLAPSNDGRRPQSTR